MSQPSYYAVIPASVRYDKRLTANAKLLYGEITALCNDKGYCWATNSYFSQLYEVKPETISRWVKALKEYGYITVKIKYVKDSKEIEVRQIRIVNLDDGGVLTKKSIPPLKNVNRVLTKKSRGIDKKVKENNTINKDKDININKELEQPQQVAAIPAKPLSKMADTLAQHYQTSFVSVQPDSTWGNYGKERVSLNILAKKTRALLPATPYKDESLLALDILAAFGDNISKGKSDYWRKCPFTPSALLARWSDVCVSLARDYETREMIRRSNADMEGLPI